jgi:hypothetical protein
MAVVSQLAHLVVWVVVVAVSVCAADVGAGVPEFLWGLLELVGIPAVKHPCRCFD